jgi:RecA/RadA recombinase
VKSAPLTWTSLRWPREIDEQQITRSFWLLASAAGTPAILEAVGNSGMVTHRLAVQSERVDGVINQLRSAVPGLAIDKLAERPATKVDRAVELRLSTRKRPLRTDDIAGTSKSILTALAQVGRGEQLVLQFVLWRRLAATPVPNHLEASGHQAWLGALLGTPSGKTRPVDADVRNALRTKMAEPGWQLVGRLGVSAEGHIRQRQLIRQVLGALRTAESPGVNFWARTTNPARMAGAGMPWRKPLRLGVSELAAIVAWPVGPTSELPVAKIGSRLVAPSSPIPSRGRVVGDATFPGSERPLSLLPDDARRHLHLIGPSGSGKTTLALSLIIQDISAGRGVVVIEPKGDLIEDVLKHIPPERIDQVVLIDPSDTGSRVVGINPMAPAGRSPELVADQLANVFRHFFSSDAPRTFDILSSAFLTLARTGGMTMAALPLLLSDDGGFRRRILAKIDDPIGLEPFWSAFENWSPQETASATAPALRRLRPFLLRPDVRVVVNQARPRFDIRQVFTERKILLINLSKGQLGPETAALLGSLIISQLWQATLGRTAIPPERRHPCFIYVDEFQDYLHLPMDFADALAQARGLGVGFGALSHQYMHQLDPAMRSAVLANAQSRVAFRLPNDDARLIAAGGALEPEDFQSLGAFQAYAQLVSDGTVQPWCSIKTRLPEKPISDPKVVLSAFALSRSPTFKLSTTGPRPFFLLHRTSLRPLTPADELCDLTGQVVG